jgi:hypothetical protein
VRGVSKRVKEFIEVKDYLSLDALIERLTEIRNELPGEAEAEIRMRGDDVFGRKLTVTYFRAQTEDEAACDARYADAYRQSREREMARLQEELEAHERYHRPDLRAVA